MRIVLFYHSLLSCWNNGNAHFLRGIVAELRARGHAVRVYEPADGWSRASLIEGHGQEALCRIAAAFPDIVDAVRPYSLAAGDPAALDLDEALDGANLVLVHEWNDPELVARIGAHRARARGYCLLFHDTHHRAVSDSAAMARLDLRHYDGVLAFGAVLKDRYLAQGWARRAWTWHEAADTRVFRPEAKGDVAFEDLVWVGNWGDGERTAELREFLLDPVRLLRLSATAYGVRYPATGLRELAKAGIAYGGWLPNHLVPATFARFRVTVHVPRRAYSRMLPGIPTIRVFEALACGIPLLCAPWQDTEGLFTAGEDYVVARDSDEMARRLRTVLYDHERAAALAAHGLATIRAHHTCAHRVDELLAIVESCRG